MNLRAKRWVHLNQINRSSNYSIIASNKIENIKMHNKDLVLLSELRKAKEKDDTKLMFTGLNLPNKEGNPDKKSFVRFEQSKFIHYRRIEKIKVNETVLTRKLSEEQLIDIVKDNNINKTICESLWFVIY